MLDLLSELLAALHTHLIHLNEVDDFNRWVHGRHQFTEHDIGVNPWWYKPYIPNK